VLIKQHRAARLKNKKLLATPSGMRIASAVGSAKNSGVVTFFLQLLPPEVPAKRSAAHQTFFHRLVVWEKSVSEPTSL
jgi:hypothetical protein